MTTVSSITATVDALLDRHYRCATSSWAGGETTNQITLSEETGAIADTRKVWSRNGKWSGQNLTRRVKVSPQWQAEVHDRGLAAVDGLLTTHASSVESPDGIEVFRATWIRQGRGLEVKTQSGAIARHTASGTTYHSAHSDPKKAVAGLKRKLTAQGVPEEVRDARRQAAAVKRAADRASQLSRLIDRIRQWDFAEIQHVTVDRRDSLSAGNCEPGTDEFIEKFFPDRSEPRATIGEIASRIGTTDPAKLAGADLTLARQLAAACLVAIRRDKQARRALAV